MLYLAFFFGGALLANFAPHFISGVLGQTFPTPFASPPFRGQSSSRVNVLYGLINLVLAYALLGPVADFDLHQVSHAAPFGLGLGLWALMISGSLGRLQKAGRHPGS